MNNLTTIIQLVQEESVRVKEWCNQNNFNNTSAVNAIVRRYRTELKELLSILVQDLNEEKQEPEPLKPRFDDGTVFVYKDETYTLYRVPGDGWQWKNSLGKYALIGNFYFDGLPNAEQIAYMAKNLP